MHQLGTYEASTNGTYNLHPHDPHRIFYRNFISLYLLAVDEVQDSCPELLLTGCASHRVAIPRQQLELYALASKFKISF